MFVFDEMLEQECEHRGFEIERDECRLGDIYAKGSVCAGVNA